MLDVVEDTVFGVGEHLGDEDLAVGGRGLLTLLALNLLVLTG